jgi:hypothetical protein
MSIFSTPGGSGLDVTSVLASGVTSVVAGKGLFGLETKYLMKDAVNHMAANAVNQMTNISNYIPLPAEAASISTDISNGALYAVANHFNPTSPFNNNLSTFLYGVGSSVASYNVTEKLLSGW